MTSARLIRCPFCGSADTELFSLFGQQLLTVQYYCRGCATPFERVRGDDVLADAARREGGTSPEPPSSPDPSDTR